ncbi:MAG: ferrous iron transport protein A [Desulfurococcaceae archaeon]|jgi:Fe2+ transport system protein FeoA|nr:ferrous iron transport protein A [Desulfurococcaceae archaeon]
MDSLSEVGVGESVEVIEVATGRGLRARLEQLGIFPGSIVEVLVNNGGHVLVRARGAVVSLSRGIASKVFVRRVQQNRAS